MTGAYVLLGVVVAVTVAGALWRQRNGRPTRPAAAAAALPADVLASLGVDPAAAPITLVQFSTAFCQPCRATRRVLTEVVELLPEVRHVEVAAESHVDEVRALRVLRTPTVLVVDRQGRLLNRVSGQPRKADVIAAVGEHLDRGRA